MASKPIKRYKACMLRYARHAPMAKQAGMGHSSYSKSKEWMESITTGIASWGMGMLKYGGHASMHPYPMKKASKSACKYACT